MAEATTVAELRALTDATVDDYSNTTLAAMLDSGLTLNAAAASIWRRKAATYAGLVDVSESGSSRSMSQLYKNAVAQATFFQDLANSETTTEVLAGRVRIKTIERG